MKKICCVVLAMLPLTAFAYPIDVEKNLNGLKINYATYATTYDMGAITLNNDSDKAAECSVVFRNGPESPRTRRVSLEAGKSADLSAKFNREIIKLYITLTCKPK
ncbi:3-phosphoglycerate kinase [Pseudomonas frederiksbergensis]|uniref:3-phosphoglycerate kinase n=1 Tax=Pseudomonas frederiksbergensis TaxID=104087 RepID=A0A1J0EHN6_9PSED|nr:3-phosphoglycerate kinase [Pseudomonas frederiksbergensis]APC15427.1 3-phosphoglycerate kinase [Pseudomonas frederiksbergensis]